MAITIDERKMSERQNKHIRKMLSPINAKIAVEKKIDTDCIRFFAKDTSVSDIKVFFKTDNENIRANYFEIWKPVASRKWTLQKLYFKIVKEGFDLTTEVLSFHVDFDVVDDTYKKYPHIHIKHPTIECISNAHIPLNLNDLSDISSSIEKFNDNVSKILIAINKEFITPFKL